MSDIELITQWFSMLDQIGVNGDGSTSRLGYTDVEDKMIEQVVKIGSEYGFNHYIDEVGNTFIYNGDNTGDYTMIGSHLDSVVSGGKFDGIAGVLSGLLVMKWLKDKNLNIPVKTAIFRMEESSVFGIATVGSKLVTNNLDEASLKRAKNSEGVSLHDILLKKGYKTTPSLINKVKQYLELHIEQGRVLEAKKLTLGVVNSIAAPVRMWVKFIGKQDHSGATPMDLRQDALVAGAELIVNTEQYGMAELNNASVATVGIVRNTPNVFNVVPGEVALGIDIRGIDKNSRNLIVKKVEDEAKRISEKRGLAYEITHVSQSDPVKLDEKIQRALSKAATDLNIQHIIMPSGAGHDAMNFVDICPVGMLFVPCRDGISHNKEEFADNKDIVNGCKVLLEYITH